ncbi:MAG: MarC family protein [Pseudomonadota bacterium]|nr:MarC family protein [Pseudomonadota bacterium]
MNEFLLQAFVMLLVIINPFAVVPIFVSLTRNDSVSVRRKVAKKACLISITLLLSFAFAGDMLLDLMRISPEAFRITGSLLLLLAAIEMVLSKGGCADNSQNHDVSSDAGRYEDISVYPLSIPLLSGPGALTTVVLLMREATEISFQAVSGVVCVVFLVIAISWGGLLLGDRLMRVIGITGTNVLTRVCGIILAAVSIDGILKVLIAVFKLAKV